MTNSVDPDQTAPIGAVWSRSTLFATILNSSEVLGNYLQQTTFSDAFFLNLIIIRGVEEVTLMCATNSSIRVVQDTSLSLPPIQ